MKAVQFKAFGDRGVLEVVELAQPKPSDNKLLIEIERAGVNFVDVRERQGVYGKADTHVGGTTLPHIPGLQSVGHVVDVGPNGDRELLSKRVLAWTPDGGSYAEFVVADPSLVVTVCSDTDADLLAALPVQGLTAYLLLTQSTRLTKNESVLVHAAAGGVGSLAVQIAKLLGAGTVIGTARTEEKRKYVLEIGATHAIDYTSPDWARQVLTLTDGNGVDVLLESIGGDVFLQNFEALAPFGRMLVFGSTQKPGADFPPRKLMQLCQTVTGFYQPVFLRKPSAIQEALQYLIEKTASGELRPKIAKTLPLSQVEEAHRLLEEKLVTGTIILDPNIS